MRKKQLKGLDPLVAILNHFQPSKSTNFASLSPEFQGGMIGLSSTPAGQTRRKDLDAWSAERRWELNLAFLCGLYQIIPPDNSVLKVEAENLLKKMFGKGFSKQKDKLTRFNTAERSRIKKNGEAAWRLVEKLRKRYGLPKE